MKTCFILISLLSAGALLIASLFFRPASAVSEEHKSLNEEQALQAFSAIHPIDVHVHVFKADAAFQAMIERLNLKLVNILVMDDTLSYRKQLEPQIKDALALVRSSHGHVALCTTFDPYKFNDRSFDSESIKQVNRDFSDGALAVKIWKNIGMEIKNADGKFIMADDPKFEPIYKDIAEHGKTLMVHLAEPDVAWGPPDPSDPSWSYYQENPQWFLYNKPGFPSKQEILNARDHILAENPKLRMVGVHLGSMEKNLDNIAAHFDRYPNFAVDTAARMEYLMIAPPEKVRAFLIKYQDRVLYGTDLDLLATADVSESLKEWRSTYARDWRFLATADTFDSEGRTVHGLNLPQPVLKKIFRNNALHWIPGL
ncbi:MAG TPA: amidohydrolase family protein [Terriglobales bacterium]|nr:amidohydrolase family protein [Terriglobales bacterium]HXY15629.1 amidohydrolase family protein [Terriglobales bacterium]